jgi:uncharacterized protein (DUF2141 family)
VVIGTLSGGAGAALTITFNASATSAAIDALIQNLTYANGSNSPTGSRSLVINVTDAAGNDLAGPPTFVERTAGANPFNGVDIGSYSAPTFADLDDDGDLDALVGARDGFLYYFENIGTASAPVFTARTGAANPFNGVDVGGWAKPTFADLDGDGDLDVPVGELYGTLRYFENTGTASAPVFTGRTGAANPFNGVDVGFRSAPSFADLDGDGDLDALVGASDGVLHYFENTGTVSAAVFTARTGAANPFNGVNVGLRSAPTFADLDGDGDLDALVGEYDGILNYFENTGTASAPVFTARTGDANPFNGVDVGGYFTPTLADLDGDGDLDLLSGEGDGILNYVENTAVRGPAITVVVTAEADAPALTGLATSVTFAENTVNATPQLLDANVTFTDSDGDFSGGTLTVTGLLAEDSVSVRNQGTGGGQIGLSGANVSFGGVVIGTLSGGAGAALTITFNAAATSAAIDALIQNLTYANASDIPTASRSLVINVTDAAGNDLGGGPPSFAERTAGANPFNGVDVGGFSHPTLADLDGDGDLDAVVGENDGTLRYFENTGTASAPVFTARTGAANPFNGVDVGTTSTPTFADLDGDGDLDAVVGEFYGTLRYFENTGTASAPVFTARTGTANPFNGVDEGFSSTPTFADLDGDGDLDALVGGYNNTLRYFENTGTASAAVWTARTGAAVPFNGIYIASPAATFADLDGDGDLDALVGAYNGGLFYVENTGTTSAPVFTLRTGTANPFNGVDVGYLAAPTFADLDGDGDLDILVGEYDGVLNYVENTTIRGQAITVVVTPEADAPALTGLAASVTFGENTVNATPQLLDSEVVFTGGGSFNGGTLRVTGLLAEDSVSVRNQGTGGGQIGLSGANVTFGGVVIGTLSGGAGAALTITFNASATSAAIDALIQNLTYANGSDSPTASRTLVINVTDAAGNALAGPPTFVERTAGANPFNGVDIGSYSTPTFADLDGDGDLDALVGGDAGILNYFENTGTASAPVFAARTGTANPFNGVDVGSYISPTFADLDGDGDMDALVGENFGALFYFENTGTASAPVFTARTGAANPFNSVDVGFRSAPTFADLDGDGDLDALIGENDGTLNYFENTGTVSAPVFTERTGSANPFNGVDVGNYSNPTFADLDGDGDLDALIGELDGILNYFENTGTAAAPVFAARTGTANPFNGVDVGRFSTPTFADLDGDGDLDALVGEAYGALNYVENTTPRVPAITVVVTAEADGLSLTGLAASVTFGENTVNATPQLLDTEVVFTGGGSFNGGTLRVTGLLAEDSVSVRNQGTGGGQIGLSGASVSFGGVVIGTLSGGAGAALTITFNAAATSAAIDALIQNLTYANGSDSPTASRTLVINVTDAAGNALAGPPTFVERTAGANPFNSVDVGSDSIPVFADLDNDGDLDALVGERDGTLNYFQNTGTASAPVFTARTGTANPFSGIDVGLYSTPTLADLDGDGDKDAVIGKDDGSLIYYQNTGSASVPAFTALTGAANPLNGIDIGGASHPSFADLDGDGDLDAVIGEGDGSLNYYENTGTALAPVFTVRTGAANPLNGLDVGYTSAPKFVDLDGDGDLDAVVGGDAGVLKYYENTGTASAPVFTERTGSANPFNGIDIGIFSAPGFVDMNGDGDLDLVVGEADGVLTYYENTTVRGPAITVVVTPEADDSSIIGSESGDSLAGTGGADSIFGLGGDDTLSGGEGDDILQGGDGNDILQGGDGIDTADYSDATAGVVVSLDKTVKQNTGGAGVDTLTGIEGLKGSGFRDNLSGNDLDNILSDSLGGDDKLSGGAGNDTLSVERSGAVAASTISLKGGPGNDLMVFNGNGRYLDTVNFVGGVGDDQVTTAGALRSSINAGAGNDRVTVDTLGGSFSIELGSGTDTLILAGTAGQFAGSSANRVMDFTAGDAGDVLDLTAYLAGGALTNSLPGSNPFLDGHLRLVQSGADTLLQVDRDGDGNGSGFVTLLTFKGEQASQFTTFNFNGVAPRPTPVEGGTGSDSLIGTAGMDILNGNGGDDVLAGGADEDVLNGGAGVDSMDGGAGDDVLDGGAGSDTASYASATAGVTVNLALLTQQNTGGAGVDQLLGIENLFGSGFTDELRGNSLGNRLTDTQGGNDFLRGEGGDDFVLLGRSGGAAATSVRLNGGVGNDTLTFSGAGRFTDTVILEGDIGNDIITATGAGTVTVQAGAGDDRVTLDTLGGTWTIFLESGVDTLVLAGTGGSFVASSTNRVRDFTTGIGGDIVNLTAYLDGGALTNLAKNVNPFADGHMRLLQSGANTLLQVDRDGGGDNYQTLLTFNNTTATNFTAANFNGLSPTGAAPQPLEAASLQGAPVMDVDQDPLIQFGPEGEAASGGGGSLMQSTLEMAGLGLPTPNSGPSFEWAGQASPLEPGEIFTGPTMRDHGLNGWLQ